MNMTSQGSNVNNTTNLHRIVGTVCFYKKTMKNKLFSYHSIITLFIPSYQFSYVSNPHYTIRYMCKHSRFYGNYVLRILIENKGRKRSKNCSFQIFMCIEEARKLFINFISNYQSVYNYLSSLNLFVIHFWVK